MELCRLKDADEHEEIASPCTHDLDNPTGNLRGEESIVFSTAIANIPEHVATRVARSRYVGGFRPRWITHACARQTHLLARTAAKLPRTYDKNHHWLDVDHDSGEEHEQGWTMHLQESACTHALASPPNKLYEIEHECHHDGNLQAMEKIDDARA